MARQGETYVALYSHQPAVWTDNSQYRDREALQIRERFMVSVAQYITLNIMSTYLI